MNGYTDNEDRYDSYAHKYFDNSIDNETIQTPPPKTDKLTEISKQDILENFISPHGLDIEKYEKQINKTRKQINKLEEVKNHFYYNLIEFEMEMKNLSNNNNNNNSNNKLNIMNKIMDVQNQLDNLTNDLEKFVSKRIISRKRDS
jgi:hypothetical protein